LTLPLRHNTLSQNSKSEFDVQIISHVVKDRVPDKLDLGT